MGWADGGQHILFDAPHRSDSLLVGVDPLTGVPLPPRVFPTASAGEDCLSSELAAVNDGVAKKT